jgi:hypothetical protein
MVFALALVMIGSMTMATLLMTNRYTSKSSKRRKEKIDALCIAEAGKEQALAKLRTGEIEPSANTRVDIFSNEPFGTGHYSVSCTTNTTNDTVLINSTGVTGTNAIRLEVTASMKAAPGGKNWLQAAVTARTDVSTVGTIQIDGRDYDTTSFFGSLLGTGGVVGVAAGGTVSPDAASGIGGNSTPPQSTTIAGETVVENIDTTGYPQTPEEVLDLPAGALDAYKCATCPPSDFFGIVYSETPCDFRGGILIVHNEDGDASLGNYHQHFMGIIIADEVHHFNGGSSVLGSIFMLGREAGGNSFGNGTARIRYSSRMIAKVFNTLLPPSDLEVDVVSWREID